MKKILLVLGFLLTFISSGLTQYKDGSNALLLGGSYSIFDVEYHDLTMKGYGAGGAYESNFDGSPFAVGFSVSYLSSEDQTDSAQINLSALPLNIYGKYFFGNPTVRGYLSIGFGFTSSTITFSGPKLYYDTFDNGYAFNFGIGMNYYLSAKAFANLGYNFSWWENNFLNDGIGHNFIVGLGFQF